VRLNFTLDVGGATPFEIRVWDTVNGIPYGEVRSYDWVAKQVGAPKKVRAVGQALKRNRLPVIIPCHRVINKSGDLGGFSGGVDLKRKLLKIEGRIW
jgi:methylated-DNA-[protein]-cysteine S-methyltransferase